jgi:hypothetical protein
MTYIRGSRLHIRPPKDIQRGGRSATARILCHPIGQGCGKPRIFFHGGFDGFRGYMFILISCAGFNQQTTVTALLLSAYRSALPTGVVPQILLPQVAKPRSSRCAAPPMG